MPSQGRVYLLESTQCSLPSTHPGAGGCKTFPGHSGLGHILLPQVPNDPKANILLHEWLMCCTWAVCKPFSFCVLPAWEVLSRAAVFEQQTPQCFLAPNDLRINPKWSQDQPQKQREFPSPFPLEMGKLPSACLCIQAATASFAGG